MATGSLALARRTGKCSCLLDCSEVDTGTCTVLVAQVVDDGLMYCVPEDKVKEKKGEKVPSEKRSRRGMVLMSSQCLEALLGHVGAERELPNAKALGEQVLRDLDALQEMDALQQ